MKRTAIFLPEPLLARLRKMAEKKDTTVSELIRRAIEAFLEQK